MDDPEEDPLAVSRLADGVFRDELVGLMFSSCSICHTIEQGHMQASNLKGEVKNQLL